MERAYESQTRASLLLAMRDFGNQRAWAEFLRRYEGSIRRWCHRTGLGPADEDEITQVVLTKLVETIRDFDYEPRKGKFRSWLARLVRNTVADTRRRARRRPGDYGSGELKVGEWLEGRAAPADADPEELKRELEAQLARNLRMRRACEQVRGRVQDRTWQAFRLTTLEGHKGVDVAARLGMDVAALYMAKNRVRTLIREEYRRASDDEASDRPQQGT